MSWRSLLTTIFPFGKAPLIILIATVLSGAWLLLHPVPRREANLTLWTFADPHYHAYVQARPAFEEQHPGTRVDMQLVTGDAVTYRLRSAFWADLDVPDVVETEISSAGSFFQGREDDIGFMDLKPLLERDGLLDRIVKSRFSPFSHRGRIYGMPHDVHPVMLAYRRDIFEAEGIDAAKLETWDDFVAAGRRITRTSERNPSNPRYMLQMSRSDSGPFEICLFQRDGGYFDAEGRVTFDREEAVETMLWYVPLVAGPDRIGQEVGWGQPWARAVNDGYLLAYFCPDWRSKMTEQQIPQASGKMALMPLPAAQPGGRRTSTWGGTMIGITRRCQDKELAWDLAKHLYLNTNDLGRRFRDLNILPPVKDSWSHPAIQEPRDYWGGQKLGALYAALAEQTPPQYASPYLNLAKSKLGEALCDCVVEYEKLCPDVTPEKQAAFQEFVRARLKASADDVRRQLQRNPF
jgi:arabinosaccharide transport system substrate-binding protein